MTKNLLFFFVLYQLVHFFYERSLWVSQPFGRHLSLSYPVLCPIQVGVTRLGFGAVGTESAYIDLRAEYSTAGWPGAPARN